MKPKRDPSFLRPQARPVWARTLQGCLLLLGVAAVPLPALALSCGAFVSTSVTLTADLLNCPDQGLFVNGASGIVIDLNGHRITGAAGSSSGIGIVHAANVRIVGAGEITGFAAGVAVNDSTKVTVENLHLHHNRSNAVYFRNVTDSTVSDNRIEHSINGIVVDGLRTSKGNQLRSNVLTDLSSAIYLRGADDNGVYGNYIRDNRAGVGISSGMRNEVEGNGIHANQNGVVIENNVPGGWGAHLNRVHGNKIYDNDIGVVLIGPTGASAYNKYNEVKENTFYGGLIGVEIGGPKNYGTGIYDNQLYGASGAYFDDTGLATGFAGNVCTPGPC